MMTALCEGTEWDYYTERGPSGMATFWEGTQWDDYTVG